ncbi:hypothetical protein N9917_04845 [Deltaproteobacteria bacterium]|nr:hypothetical protein [Deltaproteobacteria bacterium]
MNDTTMTDDTTFHALDGDPTDFPERDWAKEQYRIAWAGWLGAWGIDRQSRWRKKVLEHRMDTLQLQISRGPGPIWKAFYDTLPGWKEHQLRMDPDFKG